MRGAECVGRCKDGVPLAKTRGVQNRSERLLGFVPNDANKL